jgi:hypothetical protein
MTAISMLYTMDRFLIAADGRCRSDDPTGKEKDKETDTAQKIFFIDSPAVKMAGAVSGLAFTSEGFDTLAEYRRKAAALPVSGFSNSHDYIHRICLNVKRSAIKAQKDGRLTFLANEELPENEEGRQFRLYALGYFRGTPFWIVGGFYHDKDKDQMTIRMDHVPLNYASSRCVSPGDPIVKMIFGDAPLDPRLAKYKKGHDNPLEYTISVIKALSDPVATEFDPFCAIVGGHIHAAQVTAEGTSWLIPPFASTE